MYIKELAISNFKSFNAPASTIAFNVPDGQTLGSGLNILVGENNTGKSTVFEAVDFVRNSTKKSIEAIRNTNRPRILHVTLPKTTSLRGIFSLSCERFWIDFTRFKLRDRLGQMCGVGWGF